MGSPIKVKDEIKLSDYLYVCIVPEQYKDKLENAILPELTSRVNFISQNGVGLYDWNKKVYEYVNEL